MMHVCDVDLVFAAGGVDEQPSFNAFPRGKLWDQQKGEKILFQILAEKKSGSHVPRRRKCPSSNLAPFIRVPKIGRPFFDAPRSVLPRIYF
jgi:hypothetical protein